MYCNGTKIGFKSFQKVVVALNEKYRDVTIWMKLSEIARYWAAKELTEVKANDSGWTLNAPFATPRFTLRGPNVPAGQPMVVRGNDTTPLKRVEEASKLSPGTYLVSDSGTTLCFDLSKGTTQIVWSWVARATSLVAYALTCPPIAPGTADDIRHEFWHALRTSVLARPVAGANTSGERANAVEHTDRG